MKKLLLAITACAIALPAFAAEKVTEVTFDKTQMKCGSRHIDDGMKVTDLKSCKNFQDKKSYVVFHDDNSGKTVKCNVDKTGDLTVATCVTKG